MPCGQCNTNSLALANFVDEACPAYAGGIQSFVSAVGRSAQRGGNDEITRSVSDRVD
jgi:hypothetical protein